MTRLIAVCCKTIFILLFFTKATAQLPAGDNHQKQPIKAISSSPVKHQLRYVITGNVSSSFGYDILDYNRIMIHQPSVPGFPGNKGFTKKGDAAKVAKLVMKKINDNIMPPTVTPQELKSLKIQL